MLLDGVPGRGERDQRVFEAVGRRGRPSSGGGGGECRCRNERQRSFQRLLQRQRRSIEAPPDIATTTIVRPGRWTVAPTPSPRDAPPAPGTPLRTLRAPAPRLRLSARLGVQAVRFWQAAGIGCAADRPTTRRPVLDPSAWAPRMATTPPPSTNLRVVDLFSGAGGISEGFRQAGYRVICGTDHDPDAVATYRHNFPEAEVVCGDIRDPEVKGRVLERVAGCDVVAGGPHG